MFLKTGSYGANWGSSIVIIGRASFSYYVSKQVRYFSFTNVAPTLPGKVLWYCGGLLLFYLALHSYPAMAAASDSQQLSLQYSL